MTRACLILSLMVINVSLVGATEDFTYFEKHIRPVLIEKCYSCHSAQSKSVKGGLLLDSKAGLLKGGDTGPAINLQEPSKSLLLEALRYEGDVKMPPKGKLADQTIQQFEEWIKAGAPDPRSEVPTTTKGIDLAKGKQWWSYQPLKSTAPQTVKNTTWPRTEIDRYLLAAWEKQGRVPAADAERRVLAQRLSFDLTGLPPSLTEQDAFLADTSPQAIEKLVDRLLASPRFGEHWARHWLDVTRFGESLTLRGFVLKDAWRYRQYVIDSFNSDVPYDQFLREQIAGDLVPAEGIAQKQRQTVATTFLALGNHNLEEQDKKQLEMDIVDEQLDAITRGFLAQTVTCARCHDHKFDPIPTKDYYALAGILKNVQTVEHANVSKWMELELPADPATTQKLTATQQRIKELTAQLKKLKANKPVTIEVVKSKTLPGIVVDDSQAKKVGDWKLSTSVKPYIDAGYLHDDNNGKGKKTVTFTPELPVDGKYEVRLSYTPGTNRSTAVPVTIFGADGEVEKKINQQKPPTLPGGFISLGVHRFEKAGQSFVIVANEGTTGHVIADAVQFLSREVEETTTVVIKEDPAIARLEKELKEAQQLFEQRPTRMGVNERASCGDCRVHIRGLVGNQGDVVPRGFLQVASLQQSFTFTSKESGRRQLADWITHRDNPFTARVIVNRVWLWLMGEGLCRTPDNFGTTGEKPVHPELLDHLALRFINEGWSIKKLIRHIVLSHAYQTVRTPRRLEAEALRDRLLVLCGSLDLLPPSYAPLGKLNSDYNYVHQHQSRSVYLPAFRNSPEPLLEAFDLADPSTVVGQRNVSTVAPQALYLMNHASVHRHCELAATRLLKDVPSDPSKQIDHAYRLALGRLPSAKEKGIVERTLELQGNTPKTWATIMHALVCSLDFRYVE